MIEVNGVSKSYGKLEVLKDISLQVEAGQVVAIVGPSGSGKSTFLRMLNGLESFSGGSIKIDGHDLSLPRELHQVRKEVGMVFQQFNLFPHLTVGRNVTIAQRLVLKESKAAAEERARRLLARVGLQENGPPIRASFPADSSSGWRSRGRWRWSRRSCSSTRRPPRSIRNLSARCWTSCARWRPTA